MSASELGTNSVLTRSTLLLVCANQGNPETKARPKEDQKELRRNIEESCVCTHAKVPARSGPGPALGLMVSILLMTICFHARAQQRNDVPEALGKGLSVSGKVISAVNGSIIRGATITNKRTGIHAVTDGLGEYRISAKPDDVLRYSYMGYISVEERIDGRERITVALDSAEHMLEEVEVVSTGYQTLPKERATGSFVFVDSALLNRAVSTDIISRLKGVVPSLMFDERAGGDPKLSIRGRSTIFANADPLIVVDNFPYEGDIRNINPNDVESVSILRDAAAASIWGVRAGNGVIVITTKKGKAGQPLQVSFNGNVTVGEKPDLWYEPRISTSDFIDVERFLFDNGYFNTSLNNAVNPPALSPVVELLAAARDGELTDGEAQRQIDALRNIDYRNELSRYFYRRSVRQQYALDLSGGGDRTAYRYSASLDRNQAHTKGESFGRIVLAANQRFMLFANTTLNGGLYYTRSSTARNLALSQFHMGSRDSYPYVSFADDAGNYLPMARNYRLPFVERAGEMGLLDWHYRPLQELESQDNTQRLIGVRSTAGIEQRLFDGFRFKADYQYETQATADRLLQSAETYYTRDLINRFSTVENGRVTGNNIPVGGILSMAQRTLASHNFRAVADYDGSWQGHQLAVIGGFEVRDNRIDGNSYGYYGYDGSTGTSSPVNYDTLYRQYPSGTATSILRNEGHTGIVDRYRSWFANAAYTVSGRYTWSASGRMDQSNLFGVRANQRSVPLWSAGFLWQLHNEPFFGAEWVDRLRLRLTYGYNGNMDQQTTAFATARFLSANINGQRYASLQSPPNPNLRWEKTAMWNASAEFGLFADRISGSVEYYERKGDGLIGYAPLEPTRGITRFRGNVANMESRGLDVLLEAKNVNGSGTAWHTSFNGSFVSDRVTQYGSPTTASNYLFVDASLTGSSAELSPTVGRPLFGVYSYPWAGLDPETGDPRGYLNGRVSGEYNQIISAADSYDSLVYHGRATPSFFGSLMNTFTYRRVSLSVNLTYKLGYSFRRASLNYSTLFAAYNGHADFARRWQQPGDEQHTDVPAMRYPLIGSRETFYSRSSILVERGDHIRLQDVRVSYALPAPVADRLGLQRMEFYAYAANLAILWRANDAGLDPDYGTVRLAGSRGLVLPAPPTYALGINVNLN